MNIKLDAQQSSYRRIMYIQNRGYHKLNVKRRLAQVLTVPQPQMIKSLIRSWIQNMDSKSGQFATKWPHQKGFKVEGTVFLPCDYHDMQWIWRIRAICLCHNRNCNYDWNRVWNPWIHLIGVSPPSKSLLFISCQIVQNIACGINSRASKG